jgi:hypothetical protein
MTKTKGMLGAEQHVESDQSTLWEKFPGSRPTTA